MHLLSRNFNITKIEIRTWNWQNQVINLLLDPQGFPGGSYYGSPAQYRGSSINQISSPQGPGYVSSPPQVTLQGYI